MRKFQIRRQVVGLGLLGIFVLIVAAVLLSNKFLLLTDSSVLPEASVKDDAPVIYIASDIHYLAPELTDNGEFFDNFMAEGDGKSVKYIDEITDEFLAEVAATKPDALIISGDLTFNGEKASHEALAKKLVGLQKQGVKVLVIPGNHDVNNPSAIRFCGKGYERVDSVTAKEFASIYEAFGYDDAYTRAYDSLSYVYPLRSDLWLLMLDTSTVADNAVTDETLGWVRKVLKKASSCGAQVISVSHQAVLNHNPITIMGYTLTNASDLISLYDEFDVTFGLCGHMHMQRFDEEDGLEEIVTGALSVYPFRYGIVNFHGGRPAYSLQNLPVENMPFAEDAREGFASVGRKQVEAEYPDVPAGVLEIMVKTFEEASEIYFAGGNPKRADFAEGAELWKNAHQSFQRIYILSILK